MTSLYRWSKKVISDYLHSTKRLIDAGGIVENYIYDLCDGDMADELLRCRTEQEAKLVLFRDFAGYVCDKAIDCGEDRNDAYQRIEGALKVLKEGTGGSPTSR